MPRKRVAILISGRGSNMAALIDAAKDPAYPAEIVAGRVKSAGGRRTCLARNAGIATEIVDHKTFGKDREGFERELQAMLEAHRIDIVCLAGFMRLLTPWLVSRWENRMLNIHPALLPAFKGLDTHARALAAGVKIHGATVHFVVPEMDSGPIIAQGAVTVRDDDTRGNAGRPRDRGRAPDLSDGAATGRGGNVRIIDGRCHIDGNASDAGSLIAPLIRAPRTSAPSKASRTYAACSLEAARAASP